MKKLSHLLRFKHKINGWMLISGIGALAALLPSLYILTGLLSKPNENWAHIKQYMLIDYAWESVILVVGAVFVTLIIGVSLAWLTAAYEFPLRKFFRLYSCFHLRFLPISLHIRMGKCSVTRAVSNFFAQ